MYNSYQTQLRNINYCIRIKFNTPSLMIQKIGGGGGGGEGLGGIRGGGEGWNNGKDPFLGMK